MDVKKILVVASENSYRKFKHPENTEIIPYFSIGFEKVPFLIPDVTQFDWILFSSRRGVEFFLNNGPSDILASLKIAAIGEKTAQALEEKGIITDFIPERYASSSFYSLFTNSNKIEKGMLFPTSDLSDNTLANQFTSNGYAFKKVVVYKTVCQSSKMPGDFKWAVFASPSCFNCFLENEGKTILAGRKLVAIGDKTEAAMKKEGFNPLVPGKFTLECAVQQCLEEQ